MKNNKAAQGREKNILGLRKDTFNAIAVWALIVLILALFFSLKSGSIGSKECPESVEGNLDASLTLKYFHSPFCIYCWFENPQLKQAVEEKGSIFRLERYDVRYCKAEIQQYNVGVVPTHVFSNGIEDNVFYGYMNKKRLTEQICSLAEGC